MESVMKNDGASWNQKLRNRSYGLPYESEFIDDPCDLRPECMTFCQRMHALCEGDKRSVFFMFFGLLGMQIKSKAGKSEAAKTKEAADERDHQVYVTEQCTQAVMALRNYMDELSNSLPRGTVTMIKLSSFMRIDVRTGYTGVLNLRKAYRYGLILIDNLVKEGSGLDPLKKSKLQGIQKSFSDCTEITGGKTLNPTNKIFTQAFTVATCVLASLAAMFT
jgi:hypothetical protein